MSLGIVDILLLLPVVFDGRHYTHRRTALHPGGIYGVVSLVDIFGVFVYCYKLLLNRVTTFIMRYYSVDSIGRRSMLW